MGCPKGVVYAWDVARFARERLGFEADAPQRLVDEAARVSDELYKAVRPFLAVGGGDLWLMSTPFGKRGFFHEEWSREGRWAKFTVKATDCPRIRSDFLEEEKAAMGEKWFR